MEPDVRERFERLEANLAQLTEIMTAVVQVARSHEEQIARLTEAQNRLTETQNRLAEAQAVTQEELTTLIRMMDEWIRRNPGEGADPPPRS